MQLADRLIRAGDNPVARFQATQHFEVAIAGDADFDRTEADRVAGVHDEHPFDVALADLLARFPAVRRLRCVAIDDGRIFAHSQCDDRNRQDALADIGDHFRSG